LCRLTAYQPGKLVWRAGAKDFRSLAGGYLRVVRRRRAGVRGLRRGQAHPNHQRRGLKSQAQYMEAVSTGFRQAQPTSSTHRLRGYHAPARSVALRSPRRGELAEGGFHVLRSGFSRAGACARTQKPVSRNFHKQI
jgi:hypothetical protein